MKTLILLPILCLALALTAGSVIPDEPIVTPYGGGGLVDF